MVSSLISGLLLAALPAIAVPVMQARADADVQQSGDMFAVQDVGTFTKHSCFNFADSDSLPDGLVVSTDSIESGVAPFSQQYTKDNVYIQDGVLNMKVPGGQTQSPILGSQIVTTEEGILFGSIRTIAKVSAAGGTCSGFFSYNNKNLEETDIEILTSNLTAVHYTNQNPHASEGGPRETTTEGEIPDDATSAFHEYRTDWLPGKIRWYLDGVFQAEIDDYTPTAGTPWVWNNWSNGDDGWSAGPPNDDNVLQIQRIEMYYNTTSSGN